MGKLTRGSLPLVLAALGCSNSPPEAEAPLTPPARLCVGDASESCFTPRRIEGWLTAPSLEILGVAETHQGIQGALVFTLRVVEGDRHITFRAKWRAVSTTNEHNDPRRELAAYEVQKLFLDPAEYVAPPTRGRCIPLSEYRMKVDAEAESTFRRVACVFGFLSYWLEEAKPLDDAEVEWFSPDRGPLDEDLLERSPMYGASLARTNLFMYLIDHDDSHGSQFLMNVDLVYPVIYSIDNSMAFEAGTNPTLNGRDDWSKIQVRLPGELIRRVREMDLASLERLGVIQQFRVDGERLTQVRPIREMWPDWHRPVGWSDAHLRVGLKREEMDQVWLRREVLLDGLRLGLVRKNRGLRSTPSLQ